MGILLIYERILIFCEKNLLIYEQILKPGKIRRFVIIIIRKKVVKMALNMTKKEVEQLQALKKKQKAINKERSQFKKMILENREYVIRVLNENKTQT